MENPNYYAIIPADVRYNNNLPANAKLLYGEITALCNKEGYCLASNGYFEELYSVSPRVVRDCILGLRENGYIKLVYEKNSNRKIFLCRPPTNNTF